MAQRKAKEKKIQVYLTDEQKLQIMREYDESNHNASMICKKWGISSRSLYNYKNQMWAIYETTKETMNNPERIATLNTVKVDNSRKMALLERKSASVIEKVLNLMEFKLDLEEQRLQHKDKDEPNPVKESPITVSDLTRFFQAAAPYFFRPLQTDEGGAGKTIMKTHSYITNILNQQINGNNKDAN